MSYGRAYPLRAYSASRPQHSEGLAIFIASYITFGSNAGGGEASTSEVAEVIVFNRILTSAERAAVFSYLKSRYGI